MTNVNVKNNFQWLIFLIWPEDVSWGRMGDLAHDLSISSSLGSSPASSVSSLMLISFLFVLWKILKTQLKLKRGDRRCFHFTFDPDCRSQMSSLSSGYSESVSPAPSVCLIDCIRSEIGRPPGGWISSRETGVFPIATSPLKLHSPGEPFFHVVVSTDQTSASLFNTETCFKKDWWTTSMWEHAGTLRAMGSSLIYYTCIYIFYKKCCVDECSVWLLLEWNNKNTPWEVSQPTFLSQTPLGIRVHILGWLL